MQRLIAFVLATGLGAPAIAAPVTYELTFTGAGTGLGGDATGSASGTLTLDPEPGIYGNVGWDFTYENFEEPSELTGMHIHEGSVSGPIHLDMGVATDGGPGTLIQSWSDADWGNHTTWLKEDLQAVIDDPTNFYVNIHTEAHPPGAVGAQIPEPGSLAALGMTGLILFGRRRRHY